MVVEIYTTTKCKFCAKLKKFLKANKITYIEHDVNKDTDKHREMVEFSGQHGVPVVRINSFVVGFNEEPLKEMLNL